jgi:hypothetical protein
MLSILPDCGRSTNQGGVCSNAWKHRLFNGSGSTVIFLVMGNIADLWMGEVSMSRLFHHKIFEFDTIFSA